MMERFDHKMTVHLERFDDMMVYLEHFDQAVK